MGETGAGAVAAADSPLSAYARWASGVAGRMGGSDRERLAYLGLGLASEAGEVADVIKRLTRDGRLDVGHLADELGDVAFYWAGLCRAIGREPADILAASRAKIESRLAGAAA
jgi:NTP pyrophosphatase (non-canonical NTP hydrolase)